MSGTPADTLENKLHAARTRLIMERPFLGALALRLTLTPVDASRCQRAGTDARSLFYNPDYVDLLNLEQTQFMVAAQALHCGLLHFIRRGNREQQRWVQACEYVVNQILLDEGLQPPPDARLKREFDGMTAEAIYALLESPRTPTADPDTDAQANEQGDEHADGQHGEPPELATQIAGAADADELARQWRARVAGAARQAQATAQLSSGLARHIDLALRPRLPWRAVLAQFLNQAARDDYSYLRPSNRRGEPAIFAGLRSSQLDLVVAVDVSGSIDAEEFSEFMTEVDALKAQVRARVTLLTCDSSITGDSPWVFEAWDTCRLPTQFTGSGGTDFRPVFDWIATLDRAPDLLVYFTDGAGHFPDTEPGYPVLWLVKGTRSVPFGVRVALHER